MQRNESYRRRTGKRGWRMETPSSVVGRRQNRFTAENAEIAEAHSSVVRGSHVSNTTRLSTARRAWAPSFGVMARPGDLRQTWVTRPKERRDAISIRSSTRPWVFLENTTWLKIAPRRALKGASQE